MVREEEKYLDGLIDVALTEDVGVGDVTTAAVVPKGRKGLAEVIARDGGVIAGLEFTQNLFKKLEKELKIGTELQDGQKIQEGEVVLTIEGELEPILRGERVALNFLGRLSGIATLTSKFVERIKGTKSKILDTRKTTPGMRLLEKYAVTVGGGENHRFGLYDMILIKENHLAASGGIEAALRAARLYVDEYEGQTKGRHSLKIEVEVKNTEELKEALKFSPDIIMLDNFEVEEIKEGVEIVKRSEVEKGEAPKLEVSGGVNLKNVREIAETGVDFISVGALTHSPKTLDFSLLIREVYE
ncbi:MAG: carboxylating nicotinate-nucleotide diphosphorylase [Candidatus Zixiibacteriota bacterium]|nr:MAG: carboxylating nicotinate-nucleotide diphosphorylase [candidate division Zixibacteria bacterium]